jgi:hypothetical protein
MNEGAMNCREFQFHCSAFLDGRMTPSERAQIEVHLRDCAGCRRAAAEARCLLSQLGALGRPEMPAALSASIRSALHRESRRRAADARRRADLIDFWRMRIFSQTVGAVISLMLFLAMSISVFRPAYRALSFARAAIETTVEETGSDEVRLKILLLEPPPPPPPFSPSGALLGFSESLSDQDILIATVKVRKDGRASVTEVVTSRDAQVVDRLSNALIQQASFRPARRITTDAVLMFSKMNISG